MPASYPFGYVDNDRRSMVDDVVPLMAGEELVWTLEDETQTGVGSEEAVKEAV